MKSEHEPTRRRLELAMWACAGSAIACIVGGVYFWIWIQHSIPKSQGHPDISDLGNYGSYLQGTVASLWALAGVFLIVLAFLGQQQQLRDQEAQFRIQYDSIKQQNFETAFFQLLNLQTETTSRIREIYQPAKDYLGNPSGHVVIFEGSECFERFYKTLKTEYFKPKEIADFINTLYPGWAQLPPENQQVLASYLTFYQGHQKDLGKYFRNLYHLVKFVKFSETENKKRYTSLVRAQLSAYEVVLLFYDGISPYGEKFKPLIEEFGLLEHLDKSLLLNDTHESFYKPGAYAP